MKAENRRRLHHALMIASELIRGHVEVGLAPEDVGETTEDGLMEYTKATQRASKLIKTLANKYGGEDVD